MQITNSLNRYGIISILLHWLMALLIIVLLAMGLYMTRIPVSLQKLKLYGWHKELGVLVLMLLLLRIIWRLTNIAPLLPESLPAWQKLSAHAMHLVFYGFMVVLPLSGMLITAAAGLPISFFGLFVIPNLIAPDENLRVLFTTLHTWLAYGIIAAICAHVSAALKHHFIDKDDILRRIL